MECVQVRPRAHTYASVCKYAHTHVCTFWQVQFLILYHCSNPHTTKPHTQPHTSFHTHSKNTCVHLPTCPPAHPALPHLTHKQLGICHRGGVTHTHTHTRKHKHTRTHKQRPVVCSERTLLTLWQVHGGSQSEGRSLRAGLQVRDVPSP